MGSLQLMNEEFYDFATSITNDQINGLLDGKGFVHLIDFAPRIVPKNYTPEYRIVQAARTSYGKGLKDPSSDTGLLNYLYENKHTSPLEFVNVTFLIKVPQVIGVHILRHRTGKYNCFSARYSEVDEEMGFYDPLKASNGIRYQSLLNKQSSQREENKDETKVRELMTQANYFKDQLLNIYTQLHSEYKVAKEIARFWLPQAQYQIMYVQFDLNNLIKLLYARNDEHAQYETQVYAQAIETLCLPIFPTILNAYKNQKLGMSLCLDEVESIYNNKQQLETKSKSRKDAYAKKYKRLRKD